ncbi:hypothetical protein EX30DRAFT_343449 [Ascodesmis nigricans]|uniref:Uncharacterized protein n=1 Tax=Ascodesmis nigricans TaxID=341454 RepID=A0A4S2MMF1_9PEZI|nr:hypothetical protein EX30DRAFT_343449 [Ascodesmis nigricans]
MSSTSPPEPNCHRTTINDQPLELSERDSGVFRMYYPDFIHEHILLRDSDVWLLRNSQGRSLASYGSEYGYYLAGYYWKCWACDQKQRIFLKDCRRCAKKRCVEDLVFIRMFLGVSEDGVGWDFEV